MLDYRQADLIILMGKPAIPSCYQCFASRPPVKAALRRTTPCGLDGTRPRCDEPNPDKREWRAVLRLPLYERNFLLCRTGTFYFAVTNYGGELTEAQEAPTLTAWKYICSTIRKPSLTILPPRPVEEPTNWCRKLLPGFLATTSGSS